MLALRSVWLLLTMNAPALFHCKFPFNWDVTESVRTVDANCWSGTVAVAGRVRELALAELLLDVVSELTELWVLFILLLELV